MLTTKFKVIYIKKISENYNSCLKNSHFIFHTTGWNRKKNAKDGAALLQP
jgi:hypothetical protein